MASTLDLRAEEEGTYVINCAFDDEDDNPVVPTSASWTLSDAAGSVINGKTNVPITGLAASKDVILTASDLAIPDGVDVDVLRFFRVTYTYISTLGTLTHSMEAEFTINNHMAKA